MWTKGGFLKSLGKPFLCWFHFRAQNAEVHIHAQANALILLWLPALLWYALTLNAVPAVCFWSLTFSILFSYYWVRQNALFLNGRRELKYAAFQVGDLLEEEVRLENSSWVPVIWARFKDQSSIPGYTIRSVRTVSGQETSQFTSTTLCEQRGVYSLGPWTIQMADPLGLFLASQTYTDVKEIVVYPPLAVLPGHLLAHHQTRGDLRRMRQALEAETINASTVRAYHPGDPLKRVHWPSSARRQQLYIKTFEPETSSRVWLIPDLDAATQIGNGKDSTLEAAAILLASLANQLLRDRLAVGLFARDEQPRVVLPERGQAHLWTLLRAIAPLKAVKGQTLRKTIRESKALISENDLMVIITPSIETKWTEEIAVSARLRGVDVLLLDAQSFGAEFSARGALQSLVHRGIACQLVQKSDIRPLPASYGALRRWEFKTLGTGRVIVQQSPRSAGPRITRSNPLD
ncbi:hypothetical protein ADN00_06100 [Ornatilinea apprima]|uniref:DUF58 domain-containing protein n=2 Tax=Ornatilinea apprima TaxID=1134406 RepID=A0A0P6YAC8_9CHLR|nr:hypothetical protein ADN00_06100 [Ornatilinea apprima]